MDGITSFIVWHCYRDDRRLVYKKRISAIVGACYLLNLRRFHPEDFRDGDERLVSTLLFELEDEAGYSTRYSETRVRKSPGIPGSK